MLNIRFQHKACFNPTLQFEKRGVGAFPTIPLYLVKLNGLVLKHAKEEHDAGSLG
jgi:hypothetical protein